MKIDQFAVEGWMTDHENCCEYNMADSCCAALTVRSLLDLAGDEEKLKDIVLDYGRSPAPSRCAGRSRRFMNMTIPTA